MSETIKEASKTAILAESYEDALITVMEMVDGKPFSIGVDSHVISGDIVTDCSISLLGFATIFDQSWPGAIAQLEAKINMAARVKQADKEGSA